MAQQAGLLSQAGKDWDVVAHVRCIDLDAKGRLNDSEIAKVDVNPLVHGIGVTFRL